MPADPGHATMSTLQLCKAFASRGMLGNQDPFTGHSLQQSMRSALTVLSRQAGRAGLTQEHVQHIWMALEAEGHQLTVLLDTATGLQDGRLARSSRVLMPGIWPTNAAATGCKQKGSLHDLKGQAQSHEKSPGMAETGQRNTAELTVEEYLMHD